MTQDFTNPSNDPALDRAELAQALPLLQLLLGLLEVPVLLLALLGLPLNAQLVVGVACGVRDSAVIDERRRQWRRQWRRRWRQQLGRL